MKMTKSELRNMIREVLHEEMLLREGALQEVDISDFLQEFLKKIAEFLGGATFTDKASDKVLATVPNVASDIPWSGRFWTGEDSSRRESEITFVLTNNVGKGVTHTRDYTEGFYKLEDYVRSNRPAHIHTKISPYEESVGYRVLRLLVKADPGYQLVKPTPSEGSVERVPDKYSARK
jgi:hypothetical protein